MLDTNVWLDLLVFCDPRVQALAAALREGRACALVEPAMRDEFRRVLAYPALALDDARRGAALDGFAAIACVGPHAPATPGMPTPRCTDPDDQMFVDLALAAGADALLSRDDALLRMAARLRRHGIRVVTPAAWCGTEPATQISNR